MKSLLAYAAATILDWVAPRECLGCGQGRAKNSEWCRRCSDSLESNPPVRLGGLVLYAPFCHTGPLRDAIHRLKYAGRSDFAGRLVAAGFAERPDVIRSDAILVPVPLHPVRLVERGYNQSALLACALGRRWGLPRATHLLRRTSATRPQVGQTREQRAINMHGAFTALPALHGCNVWLVDDVVTTGATTLGCREALEAVGASVKGIVAVAYATGSGADAGS